MFNSNYKLTISTPCLPETVVFDSNFSLVTTTTVDGSGQYHMRSEFREEGTGKGTETGDTYHVRSIGNFTWNGAEPTHDLPPSEQVANHFTTNTKVTTPDGKIKHILSKVKIVVDPNGKVHHMTIDFPCISGSN